MWVEKGNGKLNNKTHYTEGVNEGTVRKVPWHLRLHGSNPIEGAIITVNQLHLF